MPDPGCVGREGRVETRIRGSRKYADIHPAVIRRQVEQFADRFRSDKELEQAVRRKLHQAFGAYLEGNWLRKFKAGLKALEGADADSVRQSCRRLMHLHTSTRERLDVLGDFRDFLDHTIPQGATVLDVACGLNVLTFPAVEGSRTFRYIGVDLHEGMISQLRAFARAVGLDAEFVWADILSGDLPACDVALMLKLLPCLGHQEDDSALRLVRDVNAEILIVSYPTRSIGGTDLGMANVYQRQIERIASETGRNLERFDCPTESFYVLR